MVKKLRAALILGGTAVAYKLMTRKPLITDENIRNGAVGAFVGMYGVPKLEKLVREGTSESKRIAKNSLIGGTSGAAVGYLYSKLRNSDYED